MSAPFTAVAFIGASIAAVAYYGAPYLETRGAAKLRHMPGPMSDGHYQLEARCDLCHTPFGGVKNEACRACHGAALAAADDSHPEAKFRDPRAAEQIERLDARACATCHEEHIAERTRRTGVTIAAGFCASCHTDIAAERPDHAGVTTTSCADAGCHNYHDNRALNEDFLVKHLGDPATVAGATILFRTHTAARPDASLDAPAELEDTAVRSAWSGSAHAGAGVTCRRCHLGSSGEWQRRPGTSACRTCHVPEGRGLDAGKHGMRRAADLAAMTPAAARRRMRGDAPDRDLGCGTCHDVHDVDVRAAAVKACLRCHDDEHSQAYEQSPHYALWQRELAGLAPLGSGVSCATCHLPRAREDSGAKTTVAAEHDQNANLRPTSKMIRSVCLACHGAGYAIDALADRALVARNFAGSPTGHVATLDWISARLRKKASRTRDGVAKEGAR
jgi:predicted CXXCH cytochrome family protein